MWWVDFSVCFGRAEWTTRLHLLETPREVEPVKTWTILNNVTLGKYGLHIGMMSAHFSCSPYNAFFNITTQGGASFHYPSKIRVLLNLGINEQFNVRLISLSLQSELAIPRLHIFLTFLCVNRSQGMPV